MAVANLPYLVGVKVGSGFLPVRACSSTVLVRTGAGGAVPASGRYQVQYGGRRGTGSTGTETVLKGICCLRLQGKHIFVRVHQTHQCIIRPNGKHNKYVSVSYNSKL